MPVGLWGDDGRLALPRSYFDMYPGIWRQGDWILFTEYGSCVVTGRSDATLNRGGVRLGTGEFYSVVEELQEVLDSLVVHLEDPEGGTGELAPLRRPPRRHRARRRPEGPDRAGRAPQDLSPRHVPDTIRAVPAIPRTLTGKKLEAPVKRILLGEPVELVASKESLLDPTAIDTFAALAHG